MDTDDRDSFGRDKIHISAENSTQVSFELKQTEDTYWS